MGIDSQPENCTTDVSIVLCGQAGQGIQTVEKLLTHIAKSAGYNVYSTKEYMSRVRGGMNSATIRISGKPVKSYADRIDIFVPLAAGSIEHARKRIGRETIIVGEMDICGEKTGELNFHDVPFNQIASGIGNKVYSNTVAVGVLAGIIGIEPGHAANCLKEYFKSKDREIIEKNIEALKEGYVQAADFEEKSSISIKPDNENDVSGQIFINGAQAVGLGALAGGCNFISSYPMSPSTGVLVFLAQKGPDFGLIAEQAEDEIAAINMAIGAWYAGARAMVTTSGGGFALMTEGVSLAGIIESPIVIHIAQRPGPATGLPTRTEQGDLELALYAGHGDFPRIILAPGTIEEGFILTQKAFGLADKYQVPVFVLTDEYFVDSCYNTSPFDLKGLTVDKHIVETEPDYKRYALTSDGISPRGIPGYGQGLVCVDSDEHDEGGRITEDAQVRNRMADKRLKKLDLIKTEALQPTVTGPEDYDNIIICWGSTYNIICEAVSLLNRDDTAVLHFGQVYPLHDRTSELISRADKKILIENNMTGAFGRVLKLHADVDVDHKILKYDGLCFAADSLAAELKSIL